MVVLITNERSTMTLVDSSGMSYDIKSFKLLVTLGIGWAAFCLSLIFNILYYALHPSHQVTLITLICLQSSLISPPGRPAGHQGEAGGGCVWL